MSKKIYTFSLCAFLFSAMPAQARLLADCVRWLQSLEEVSAPQEVKPIRPSLNRDYRKYLRARAADPRTLPPAALYAHDTKPEDLKFSFFYWWYPGNVFGPLMIPKNPELALRLIAGETVAEHMIPTVEERAEERANRAEQPIIDVEATPPTPSPPAQEMPQAVGRSPAHDPRLEERLETSPTKDHHADQPVAQPAAPAANDPGAGMADSSPPVSSGTP